MFCNQCGKEISEDSRFCSFCGNPIRIEEKEKINDKNTDEVDSDNTINNSSPKKLPEIPDDIKDEVNLIRDKWKLFPEFLTERYYSSWSSSEKVLSDAVYLGKKSDFDMNKLEKALTSFCLIADVQGKPQDYQEKNMIDKVRISIKAALKDYKIKNKGDLFFVSLIESLKKRKSNGHMTFDRSVYCIIEITGFNGKFNYITGKLLREWDVD